MALPYYKPPVTTPTLSASEYYRNSETVAELLQQLEQHYNLYKMAYQNIFYRKQLGYENSIAPAPYIPSYQSNLVVSQPTSSSKEIRPPYSYMPSLMFPNLPPPGTVPTAQEYRPGLETGTSFLSRLKSAAERLSESDAKARLESKKAAGSVLGARPAARAKPGDVIVLSDDTIVPPARALPEVSSVPREQRYAQSLAQWYALKDEYKPGRGHTFVSKHRPLVESEGPRSTKCKRSNFIKPSTESRKRKHSDSNESQSASKHFCSYWYPRPASVNMDHLYIGPNGTILPASFYATIPWESSEESTRLLVRAFYDNYALATRNLEGANPLESRIIDDIVSHVANKCFVSQEYVRFMIAKLCADTAKEYPRLF